MPHVIDNKIWHDSQKLGWIDGEHIRDMSDNKIGYFENGFVYSQAGHKVAYIHENELMYENGRTPSSLENINQEIQGNIPILTKCAIKTLFDL